MKKITLTCFILPQQSAGVILNGVLHDGDIEQALKKLELSNDEGYKKIFRLLYSENLKVNLFKRFNISKIFDLRILSVDGNYRGQGIAKNLVRKSEELAKELAYEVKTQIFLAGLK